MEANKPGVIADVFAPAMLPQSQVYEPDGSGSNLMTFDVPGDILDAFHLQLVDPPFLAPTNILLDQLASGAISLPRIA